MRKPGRPRNALGAKTIALSIERGLLDRVDRLANKRIYRTPLDQLRKIETRYGVGLNTAGKDNVSVMKGAWY
jgi:hypothetical protein